MDLPACQGCAEYNRLSRRQFLTGVGGATLAASLPAWLPRVALAQDHCSTRDVIVSIFLRGAADGMTLVAPVGETTAYYNARPTLAVPEPVTGNPSTGIALDNFFAFAPALAPLMPAYQAGHLLAIHACGSTDPSRSHFDAQRFMEIGKPADLSLFTGWLGRHLASSAPQRPDSVLRAVGIGYGLQRTLDSAPQALPIPDLDNFGLSGTVATQSARSAVIHDMYELVADPLKTAAQYTQATIDLLNTINFAGYQPAGGATYPSGSFGYAMKTSAALIKADVGVEAIAVDLSGWDTHNNQGPISGGMATLMGQFAGALAAFHADMFAGNGRNVTVVVMSEFGRRLGENGSFGTDHGHGNVMFAMGPQIAGGRVLTQWPGLATNQLFEGRDLQVTTDFRDILAEIVKHRLGNTNLGVVFPDYTPQMRGVTNSCLPGDLNCDGLVNNFDIDSFVLAITSQEAYQAANPECNVLSADIDGDGRVTNFDIDPYVNLITGN